MNATAIVVRGTVKPDGTLELEGQLPLPAGKVQVTVEPLSLAPQNHPFWQLLQEIWAARQRAGLQPRSVAEIEVERQRLRQEMDAEVAEASRLQGECHRSEEQAEQPDRENS